MKRYVMLTVSVPDGPMMVDETLVLNDTGAMRTVESWVYSQGGAIKGMGFQPVLTAQEAIDRLEKVKARNVGSGVEDWG